jgi:hypothetical protein
MFAEISRVFARGSHAFAGSGPARFAEVTQFCGAAFYTSKYFQTDFVCLTTTFTA